VLNDALRVVIASQATTTPATKNHPQKDLKTNMSQAISLINTVGMPQLKLAGKLQIQRAKIRAMPPMTPMAIT